MTRRVARLRRVFVANRGEIAVRIIRACRSLGLETVVGVSAADLDSLAARLADRAVCIGPAAADRSYLDIGVLVTAALGTGCDALHPGYGFLSERAELPEACEEEGLVFVGPRADLIRQLGDKVTAREVARRAGLPVAAGSDPTVDLDDARRAAAVTGYPILLKAVSGGGGRGMRVVRSDQELDACFAAASSEARNAFGDDRMYVERYVERGRHIEVQLVGDRHGNLAHLGERDCSVQRRHQKLVEEAPAVGVSDHVRKQIHEAAMALGEALAYDDVGTVEFLYDIEQEDFFFLEMNTRVQVEHPVTECVTGVDIVATQLRAAAGESLPAFPSQPMGHAIECRLTAEAVERGFAPTPGRLTEWVEPAGEGIRIDTHCYPGWLVSPYYDSLLAKVIVHAPDREAAIDRMHEALGQLRVGGVSTNADFHRFALQHPDYRKAAVTTTWVESVALPSYLEEKRSS